MRLILLQCCVAVAVLVLVVLFGTLARHRAARRSNTGQRAPLSEYAWAAIPWLMMAGSALPAIRLMMAST
jgi:heme/copper-type cytochrome/quinol oxidase subunit 2